MTLRRPRSKKKAVGGCLTLVAVVAAIALVGPFVRDFVDAPFNPWAHSWRGGPTLTGTWFGTVASPAGRRMGLYLDLRRARNSRGRYSTCRHCPRIEGGAWLCGGGAQSYEVRGRPDTWGGERFHLRVSPNSLERPGPRLGYVSGEWAGDALNVTTTLEQGGAVAGQDAGGQVRFEMRRGGEVDFLEACRKLGVN